MLTTATDLSQVNHADAYRQSHWLTLKVLAGIVLCPLVHRECPFATTTTPVGGLQATETNVTQQEQPANKTMSTRNAGTFSAIRGFARFLDLCEISRAL